MIVNPLEKVNTLGDWAALGIDKHLQKILSHEPEVLKDKDPEELHQMRVGMRRLRSALNGFAPVLNLPNSVTDKQVGIVSRRLGKLRDLDVLLEALQTDYYPQLPAKEQKVLETALQKLNKKRKNTVKSVQEVIENKSYQTLKKDLQKWLDFPEYTSIEQLPIDEVLPDLLLPLISNLFLHPGWQAGIQQLAQDNHSPKENTDLSDKTVEQILKTQGDTLHDLRKTIKRVRYQMSLFTDFYSNTYAAYLTDMKAIQEYLGDIQDSEVLEATLAKVLKSEIESKLPQFAALLRESRYQAWKKWQLMQRRYLNANIRQNFRSTLLHPTLESR
ncbi:MAG: CHAD domain-containing protein [Microcoleaceae cyanobacterium]